MTVDKVYVTKEGLVDLEKEYEHLIHVVRKEVIEDLQAARAQGDLSENADYDAARDRQARVEARIRELDVMLNNIEIIDNKKEGHKVVRLGSTLEVLDLETNTTSEYTIVGSVEADPLNGRLSNMTALGMALMDHHEGDVVKVNVDSPYEVKIVKIK
ncbi:MAG: transcription elongation factor GreA [Erysipelothrix sp.]|jgi:transcription elongation factor GreA|nr:transcription elongation factor GreA [Erysipelothrix sp.]